MEAKKSAVGEGGAAVNTENILHKLADMQWDQFT